MFVALILRINHIVTCLSRYAFLLETSGVTYFVVVIYNSKTKLNSLHRYTNFRYKINIDNVPFIIFGFDNILCFIFLRRMCIEPKTVRKFSCMKHLHDVKCFGSIRPSCIAEAQKRECLTGEIMQDYVDHWLSYVSLDRPIENSYYVQVDHVKLNIYLKILPSSTIH